MSRKILSDALIAQTNNDISFELCAGKNYDSAVDCDAIKKQISGCKQVLLYPENDEDSRRAAIQAKQEDRIDDFLFYDTSINYLFSKLESLLK